MAVAERWLVHRWVTPGAALLAEQAWRPVAARVVRSRWRWLPTHVEVTEDGSATVLAVTGLSEAHRVVIARGGLVWVVGPTDTGIAAVRVDGSHDAWPAFVSTGSGGLETDLVDADVTRLWSVRLRTARMLMSGLAATVMVAVTVAGYVSSASGSTWAGILVLVISAALFAAFVVVEGRMAQYQRLPELLAAGEWTKAQASLRPWRPRLDGTASATATVRVGDGPPMTAVMSAASVDLLGTVWDTGTLWFAGVPEQGRTMAVGYPDYPLLAVAVIE